MRTWEGNGRRGGAHRGVVDTDVGRLNGHAAVGRVAVGELGYRQFSKKKMGGVAAQCNAGP